MTVIFLSLDNESATTSELLQKHLPTSKGCEGLQPHLRRRTNHGQPAGTQNCRALAIAVMTRVRRYRYPSAQSRSGFDIVDAGPLKEGWRIQRDTPGTVRAARREGVRDLAAAQAIRGSVGTECLNGEWLRFSGRAAHIHSHFGEVATNRPSDTCLGKHIAVRMDLVFTCINSS